MYKTVVVQVAYSHDALKIASAANNKVELWDVSSGKKISALQTHRNIVWSIAFDPASKFIASGSQDKTACVHSVDNNDCVVTFCGHSSWVTAVTFTPDGNYVISGSLDRTTRIWQSWDGTEVQKLEESSYSLNIDEASRRAFGSSLMARAIHGKTEISLSAKSVNCVDCSRNGEIIVTGSQDGIIRSWSRLTGKRLCNIRLHRNRINSFHFDCDGSLVVSSSHDNTVQVSNVITGDSVLSLTHPDITTSANFSPAAKHIVTACYDWNIRVFSICGDVILRICGHTAVVNCVCFDTLNGSHIASCGADGSVRVFTAISCRTNGDECNLSVNAKFRFIHLSTQCKIRSTRFYESRSSCWSSNNLLNMVETSMLKKNPQRSQDIIDSALLETCLVRVAQ